MYIINNYQLIATDAQVYLSNYGKGAKISSPVLAEILNALKAQKNQEITEDQLSDMANKYQLDTEALKKVLITQLNVLKPMRARKFQAIYINSDDLLVGELLTETLGSEYPCFNTNVVSEIEANSLVIFYRKNYTHADFQTLYQHLKEDVYVVTAGVVHKLLVIDNLYFKGSGLPTHFSNLQQVMGYLKSELPATKNNWLLFYREFVKSSEQFPDPQINACQRGHIAYSLYQFALQFTNLWGAPTPLDKVNWFWHVDLSSFSVHQEVAVHSPFSEFDLRINLKNKHQEELV